VDLISPTAAGGEHGEWESVKIGDLRPFVTSGSRGWARFYSERGAPFVRITNLSRDSIYLDLSDLRVVDLPAEAREGTRTELAIGDVLISITADIGIIGYVDERLAIPAYINQHIALVRFPKGRVDSKFVSYYLASEVPQRHFREGTDTGAKAGMSLDGARDIRLELPPIREQKEISWALADIDASVVAVDRLVAKKRQIRLAAMQSLLTGSSRLPGFSGEWVLKRLGDTASLKARIGWQGLTTAEYLETGDYRLVTGTDFRDGRIDWRRTAYVAEWRYGQDRNIQLRLNDVLVTKDGTIGKIALVSDLDKPATLNSGVFVIRPIDDAFHPPFFYHLLRSRLFVDFLTQLSAGSTINHLYQKDFVFFRYVTPPTIEEQVEIAHVLSDMDDDIGALEERRSKMACVKAGMAQALVTGRVRLPVADQGPV
jgi:type I restriction enzyme, S subunit